MGASAGGLEAFSALIAALPPDCGCALVFIPHLSPQHESAMPALLAPKTRLPVVEVTHQTRAEPNHIYVVPANVHLDMSDGELQPLPRPLDRSQYTPVDFFFRALARTAGHRAIGVILSGTASDGAAGVREIKTAGGITIAQRPETAKYDGMPRAAIGTGMIDLVLPPPEIAEQLVRVDRHPSGRRLVQTDAAEEGDGLGDRQFQEILRLLRRATGVDFTSYKAPTIKRRLLRRMALHRLTDVERYLRYLREHPEEATVLYQDLLIHVTRFFREPASFESLARHVIAELARNGRDEQRIRVWVPGCATGEEAYSVAILLLEAVGGDAPARRIQIFATDVSETAIEQARVGLYSPGIADDVAAARLKRFFTRADGGYAVTKAVRDLCIFARHDLTRDPPFSRLDLLVCRNVLIYLDAPLQRRVISIFHYALKPGGFLMLGPAESPGHQHRLDVVDKKWRIYRKSGTEARLPLELPAEPVVAAVPAARQVREALRSEGRSLYEEATRLLLQRYSPAGVIVDEDFRVVQFRGQTGRFLEPPAGEPSLDLLKMAREGLLYPLRTALQAARRRRRPVRSERVPVRRNGAWTEVNLEVLPLGTARPDHFLVLFEERPASSAPAREPRGGGTAKRAAARDRDVDARVAGLTQELLASREYLQSIIQELEAANEELQSANEEILSSNEELQSANEELDTAKEELQSTNEELNTVNEELSARNEELSRANSDLKNLLASVEIAVVIVGDDMRIRRFTPMAERLLNLIPGDVGRPIGQVKPNIQTDDLEALIRRILEKVEPFEREAQDRDRRWYSLRIRPYKGVDNRIEGAVLALIDVDTAKRYQQQLERARDYFGAIVETVGEPLVVLDDDLCIKTANAAFYGMFASMPAGTEGTSLFELARREWDRPELRTALERVQNGTVMIEDVTIPQDLPGLGRQQLRVRIRRLELDDTQHWLLLALRNVDAVIEG